MLNATGHLSVRLSEWKQLCSVQQQMGQAARPRQHVNVDLTLDREETWDAQPGTCWSVLQVNNSGKPRKVTSGS